MKLFHLCQFAARRGPTLLFLAACALVHVSGCQTKPSAEARESEETKPQRTGEAPAGQDTEPSDQEPKKTAVPTASEPSHAVKSNRLVDETSPYLLQHAHNPVDWYPWGEEALKKAKEENKIIFLSIGYSSCHWCHVMERESFMDQEIADYVNKHFVCVKVDREERPEIDMIYMTSLHVFHQVTGAGSGGGWPLSMFLTPDAEPFFGGTYFPARDGDRGATVGFLTIVKRVQETWAEQEDLLRQDAKTLTRLVKRQLESQIPLALEPLDAALLDELQQALSEQFDPKYGGFGYSENFRQPKFPEPSNLFFLLDRIRRLEAAGKPSEAPRNMLLTTLDHMSRGGIRDHLGGGFHRYSVDRYWQIPHFEKMLYDNAQLASVYAEAYALSGDENLRHVATELLEFVLREMTDAQGGFYTALDADSEGEEGKFYRWDLEEVRQLLNEEEFALLAKVYQFDGAANFEEHYYVPQLGKSMAELAQDMSLDREQLETQLAPLRARLLEARGKRVRPMTDTKILTSWNGLMIRGLADAARIFDEPRYREAAEKCAQFLLDELRDDEGRLFRTYGQGQRRFDGALNDYAYLVSGLIALHRATGDVKWLETARDLTDKQIELFWDEQNKGFYFTTGQQESLLARAKEYVDNVLPAGNSVAAENLLYLAEALDRDDYRQKAEETIQAALPLLQRSPSVGPYLATAAARLLHEAAAPR